MAIGNFLGGLTQGLGQGVTLASQVDEAAKRRAQEENQVDLGLIDPRLAGTKAPVAQVLPWFAAKAGKIQIGQGGKPEGLRLKPGEMWDESSQSVRAVPGSDLYVQQQKMLGKDTGAVQGVDAKTDLGTQTIDEILDPKNKSGFESNFGGYNAFVSRLLPGNQNAAVRNKIESLKSTLKMAGLDMIRQGGSIGQMTEKEWPIVEGLIENISPTLGEEDARIALERVKAKLQDIRNKAHEKFDEQWQGTQYMDRPANRARAATTSPLTTKSGIAFQEEP